MNEKAVLIVTDLGRALLEKPQGRITGDGRLLMGLIDGKCNVAQITEKIPPSVRPKLPEIFARLLHYGVIEVKGAVGIGTLPETPITIPPESLATTAFGQRPAEQGRTSSVAEVEARRRAALEKELQEVRTKLEATIARQKKVEEDCLRLTQQVFAYEGSAQTTEQPPAQTEAASGLRVSLENINQLNQALLDQREILGNTLKLRAYQAQLNAGQPRTEHAAGEARRAYLNPHYKTLRGLEFFKGFSNAEVLDFLGLAKWQQAAADESILSEGDVGISFYIVVSGSVNIFRKGNLLTTLGRGDFFGEFAYLSGDEPVRSAHATAATACELLAVDPLDIEFSPVQLRLRVVEALLRGQVRRALLADERIDRLSKNLE